MNTTPAQASTLLTDDEIVNVYASWAKQGAMTATDVIRSIEAAVLAKLSAHPAPALTARQAKNQLCTDGTLRRAPLNQPHSPSSRHGQPTIPRTTSIWRQHQPLPAPAAPAPSMALKFIGKMPPRKYQLDDEDETAPQPAPAQLDHIAGAGKKVLPASGEALQQAIIRLDSQIQWLRHGKLTKDALMMSVDDMEVLRAALAAAPAQEPLAPILYIARAFADSLNSVAGEFDLESISEAPFELNFPEVWECLPLFASPQPAQPAIPEGWIPVSERLPEPRQDVAFVVHCKTPPLEHFHGRVLGGRYANGGFSVPGMVFDASYWQLLAAAPKPGEQEGA